MKHELLESVPGPLRFLTSSGSLRLSRGSVAAAVVSALLLACTADRLTAPLVPPKPSLIIFGGKPCGSGANPALGGENQTGQVGRPLTKPLIVQVNDVAAGTKNGQVLNFVVTSGGGNVFANVVQSANPTSGPAAGCNGIGVDTWTLGPTAGSQTVEARLVDPTSGATLTEATFHATATVGPAASVKISAGDKQSVVAGTAVGLPPAVLVTDQTGNPIPNVSITFAVASGAGTIAGASQIATSANGIAAVGGWTLGVTAGPNTLTASSTGLVGSPLTFTATGIVGEATQLVAVAGDGQRAEPGTTLPIAPAIQARDVNGNGVAGVAVTFSVTAGGGTMSGISSVTTLTNQSGSATVGWTIGTAAGPNTLRATALGLKGSPVIFNATGYTALYVANQGGNSITVYDADVGGNVAPVRTITGPNTGLNTPANIVRDAMGRLYVTNYTGQSLTIYAAGTAGDAAPVRTISGANTGLNKPYGLARDVAGQIYVFDYASASILVFDSSARGNATPLRIISGGNTGLHGAPGLKVDPSGLLYVADQDAGNIKVFAAGAFGDVAPVRTIAGPSTGLTDPAGLELDATGQLYVTNFRGQNVSVYASGAHDDATPVRSISGANTNLSFPVGLALDITGQLLYVANNIGQSITVYLAGASGNATPRRTISGPNTGLNGPGWLAF
jgi:6-phosphogluconolactonase (cycloisomerase 2 family)